MKSGTAILIVLAVVLLAAVPSAQAQEPITLNNLTIRVWPEFDQPSALVFLVGQVASGTPLPAELRFPLPAGANVHAVAFVDAASGDLLTAQYRQEGNEVVMTSPNGSFWVEFYDATLQVEGAQRTYTLTWTTPYAITTLTYEVQSPYGAQGLAVEPAGGALSTDELGLPLYTIARNGIAAGEALTLRLTYSKADSTLTADWLSTSESASQPSAGSSVPSTGGGIPPLGIALMALGGLMILGAAGYWFFGIRQPAVRRRAPVQGVGGSKRFCPRCGQPIQPGDRFCRHCGARLQGM